MPQRRFVITGGSKGIGLATAHALLGQGRRVVILSRSRPAESIDAEFIPVDLADATATRRAIDQVLASGPIDGIVNNVGRTKSETLDEVSWDGMIQIMNLTLRPAVELIQATADHMRRQKWGRIVNVTSMLVAGAPNRTSYAAAKAALTSFTRTWALELAEFGVTVNAVAPGPTQTELFRVNNPIGSEGEKRYLNMMPMKRIATPGEIASAIAFFCSDGAGIVTGQIIHADGGTTIGRLSF